MLIKSSFEDSIDEIQIVSRDERCAKTRKQITYLNWFKKLVRLANLLSRCYW